MKELLLSGNQAAIPEEYVPWWARWASHNAGCNSKVNDYLQDPTSCSERSLLRQHTWWGLNREMQYAELEAKITSTWEGTVQTFIKIRLNFKLLYRGTDFHQN